MNRNKEIWINILKLAKKTKGYICNLIINIINIIYKYMYIYHEKSFINKCIYVQIDINLYNKFICIHLYNLLKKDNWKLLE